MPRRKIQFIPDNYYHVFNRSKTRETIFIANEDYERFYKTIVRFQEEFKKNGFAIKSYCLMPNHFHLLLSPGTEKDIPLFMQKVQQ